MTRSQPARPPYLADLTWIVEEYINAPLPDEWSVVKAPNGEIHYINSRTRDNVLDNPIEPRQGGASFDINLRHKLDPAC